MLSKDDDIYTQHTDIDDNLKVLHSLVIAMHFTILIADFSSFHDRLGTKKKRPYQETIKEFSLHRSPFHISFIRG